MSGSISPTTGQRYGKKKVCTIWEFPRSTRYARKQQGPLPKGRPGPKPKIRDGELADHIEGDLKASPCVGEGHRKVWARLRRRGHRASRHRVLRVMKEKHWLSPTGHRKERRGRMTAILSRSLPMRCGGPA